MKIGEVAQRAGVSTDTVRMYERLGLLTKAARTHKGYRDFTEDVPTRVADIKVLQAVGLSFDEIRTVVYADAPRRHSCAADEPALAATVARLNRHIARLSAVRDAAEATRSACADESHDGAALHHVPVG